MKKKIIPIIGVLMVVGMIMQCNGPDKCRCNQLMLKYGVLKSDNQWVPKEDKDDHMTCVKKHFIAPTNEDGSSPCK
jgi:hypothetical protein